MSTFILVVGIIWLSGLIPNYLLFKRSWLSNGFEWSVGVMVFILAFIWTSWAGCIASETLRIKN